MKTSLDRIELTVAKIVGEYNWDRIHSEAKKEKTMVLASFLENLGVKIDGL